MGVGKPFAHPRDAQRRDRARPRLGKEEGPLNTDAATNPYTGGGQWEGPRNTYAAMEEVIHKGWVGNRGLPRRLYKGGRDGLNRETRSAHGCS